MLLLVFFLLGGILSGILGWKWYRYKLSSDKWLASFIALCVLYISPFMLGYADWYGRDTYRDILFYLPLQQLLLIGPVLYVYTKSLLNPSYRLSKREGIHFLPALLYNLAMLIVFLNDQVIRTDYFFYADGRDMDLDPWYQWTGWISMVLYLGYSIWYYDTYRRVVFEVSSFAEELLFKWMQRFLVAFLGILLLRALFFVLNPEWGEFGSKFWYYLCFSVLFSYIAFQGYIHSIQVEAGTRASLFDRGVITSALQEHELSKDKPAGPAIKDLPEFQHRLEEYMHAQSAYQNPTLTLAEVAEALQTHSKVISTVVNTQFDMNFNDWVNKYRVEAVLHKFEQGIHKEKTILGIALDSGFNSKSTFNRAFKKHTGTTPVRYLENQIKK